MAAYYNENDRFAAAWLRELIKAGLIADGEVDERSIADVAADDVRGFVQCHFFAGIGGWSYALRLAGWPDDRGVWTGSCPCQPFSSAGRGEGERDSRDLWPTWFRIIRQRRPIVCFGEQVADSARSGWLDRLCADMEGAEYSVGACVLGAHSAGAPHIRQRLYFVADASGDRLEEQRLSTEGRQILGDPTRSSRMCSRMADAEIVAKRESTEANDAFAAGWDTWVKPCGGSQSVARKEHAWGVEPDVGRVAHGISHKLAEPYLRGFGNAIVPQVAQVFIEAYMSVLDERAKA